MQILPGKSILRQRCILTHSHSELMCTLQLQLLFLGSVEWLCGANQYKLHNQSSDHIFTNNACSASFPI